MVESCNLNYFLFFGSFVLDYTRQSGINRLFASQNPASECLGRGIATSRLNNGEPQGGMKMARLKKLPKGLAEFEASLHDLKYAQELAKRLLDLPEHGFHRDFDNLKDAIIVATEAEVAVQNARDLARRIAERIWKNARENWTIKELQDATGYDDD